MLEQIIFLKQLEAKLELLEARQLDQWHAIKVMRDELAKEMARITESIQLVSEAEEAEIAAMDASAGEATSEEVIMPHETETDLAAAQPVSAVSPTLMTENTSKEEMTEVQANAIAVEEEMTAATKNDMPPVAPTISTPSNLNIPANASSINDQYNTKPSNLGEQLTLKPINDLKSAIGTNDRFLFIAQLFGGDANKFNQAIVNLNHCANLEAAIQHLHNNYKRAEWEQNHKTLEQLEIYLKRRYASN